MPLPKRDQDPHIQSDINARNLGHLDGEALPDVLLEALDGNRQRICSGGQLRDRIVARCGASSLVYGPGLYVLGLNRSARDYGARRIRNRPGNGASIALSDCDNGSNE
jgi:hypothetical protein